jgi:ubiquinone/menaquinone biosynthesis C-methylase UbiE
MRRPLGELSDIEAVEALVDVSGLALVDVGCGSGATARLLAERGATVVGLEPDPVQAAQNAKADPTPGVTLFEGHGEALPQQDDSVDGVFFFRSLHHVPAEGMDTALSEAHRVVRPGGFVLVVEPGMEGTHFEMMRPFHDEGRVRTLAQQALQRTASRIFASHQGYECLQFGRYDSFEALVTRFSSMSFNDIDPDSIDVPEVRAAFERARTESGYVFDQPILIDLYRVG